MLLILTNSIDGTSDEIVRRIGTAKVFRFNIDLWREYEIHMDANGFTLRDPTGRQCISSELKSVYLRKPTFDDPLSIPEGGCPEGWLRSQMSYFLQELYNQCREMGLVRLVEKGAQNRLGKFSQLRMASRYFHVPQWAYVRTDSCSNLIPSPCITKPLTADFVENYRVMFTRTVNPDELDPSYPWLLQQEIRATHDVTVVFVAGHCFTYSLERSSFEGVDWRKHINRDELVWRAQKLPIELEENIRSYMKEAGLEFGRLDFLKASDDYFFLEVNPNGQWAWLDEDGSHGVFDAIVAELTAGWNTAKAEQGRCWTTGGAIVVVSKPTVI